MKTRPIIWLIAFSAFIISSCGENKYSQKLARIDSLSNINPDSARKMLEGIKHEIDREGEPVKMLYNLINYKTKDKCYQPIQEDSSILEILSYYEKESNNKYLPMAKYYAGRYYVENGDGPKALEHFYYAYDNISDAKMKTGIASQISYIFRDQNLHQESVKWINQSLRNAIAEKDTIGIIFSYCDLGKSFTYYEERDSALAYYHKALRYAKAINAPRYIAMISAQIALSLNKIGKVEEASSYLAYALKYGMPIEHKAIVSASIEVYNKLNKTDSLFKYIKELEMMDDPYAKQYRYQILSSFYLKEKDFAKATQYQELYFKMGDTINLAMEKKSVAKAQALYNYHLRQKEAQQLLIEHNNTKALIWMIACIAISIIAILLIFIYSYHKSIKKMRLKLRIYFKKLNNSTDHVSRKERILSSSEIYHKIHQNVKHESFKLTPQDWEELSSVVESVIPNHKNRLDKLVKGISEYEYKICLLLIIKIRLIDIANLTNHTKAAISATRRRLYKRAFDKDETPAEWDKVMLSLDF